jgi:hypothetical protein
VAGFLCLDELLRLRESDSNKSNKNGEAGSDPEDNLPAVGRVAYAKVGASSQNITEGVSLLQDTTHETTSICTIYVRLLSPKARVIKILTGSSQVP